MNDLLFGIFVVAFCVIGYLFSWKYQRKNNYTVALFLLILCGLLLRVYTSADFFLHTWDESFNALVAKNVIHHPFMPTLYDNPILPYDYKNWTVNHIWLHKQPLSLWTMAGSMSLFGCNEIALRLPSILLTSTGIWLTYLIGKYFFTKPIAYLAAFFYSINGLIIELTSGRVATDHVDVFFLFFIELAIVFCIQYVQRQKVIYSIFTGICIGAAILSKSFPALIVFPIWFLLLIDSKKFTFQQIVFQTSIVLISCVIIFLPWQIYIHTTFPLEAKWEEQLNFRHLTEVIEGRGGSFFYFINQMRINYGDLIYIPFCWFIWKVIKNKNDKKRLALFIWIVIPLIFFSFAKTKMQAYIVFTAPALFLMTSEFYFSLKNYLEKDKQKKFLRYFLFFILFCLIGLPFRYTLERIKPFEGKDRTPSWVVDLKQLDKRKIRNGILFNYDKPTDAMFYTDLTAYSIYPNKNKINELIKKGFTVLLYDKGNFRTLK